MKFDRAPAHPRARWAVAVLLGAAAALPAGSAAQSTDTAVRTRPELRVQNLRPGFDLVTGAGGNVLVWSGPDGVVLVDTGQAVSAQDLLDTVARIAPGPLRFVIDTHAHADHVGGNELAARKGAVVIGHETMSEPAALAAIAAAGRPVVTTADGLALHLNDDRLDAMHVANAHTRGDIVVRWMAADVVDLGDVYVSNQYPLIDLDGGGSLAGTVAATEAALARIGSRTVVVPGHGPVSNRAELAAWRDMLVAVGRKVREGVEQGRGLEQILETHPTAEFDARYARPGAPVTPDAFVRIVYRDLARPRSAR